MAAAGDTSVTDPIPPPAPSSEIEDRQGVTSPTPSLPPSYEQALQHRTIEYNPYQGSFGGHNGLWGQDDLGGVRNLRRYQGHGRVHHPIRLDSESDDDNADGCVKMTLPPMHMCMAVTCLVLNFLIPGSGTMLGALGVFCCIRPSPTWTVRRKMGACCLNIAIGLAQLLLTPVLLLGWVWSILWGFAFVGVSHAEYHGAKRETETSTTAQSTRGRVTTATVTQTREITLHRHTSSSFTRHEVTPVIHAPPRDHQRELSSQSEDNAVQPPNGTASNGHSRASISSSARNSRRNSLAQSLGLHRNSVEPVSEITCVSA